SDGRSGGLDTLPEGKLADSQSQPQSNSAVPQFGVGVPDTSSNLQYKRVYPDWKPAIDKTDVVGTMEAIAEAQPTLKDKSSWRKSNLNVPNTTEETELEVRRLRRMRSRGTMDPPPSANTLHAIKEEVKRRNIPIVTEPEHSDHSVSDRDKPKLRPDSGVASAPGSPLLSRSQFLNRYRNPSDAAEDFFKSIVGRPDEKERDKEREDDQLPPFVPRRLRKPPSCDNEIVSDRIEIDSDNIETPPATRKVFHGLQQQTKKQTPRRSASRERILSTESFTKINSDGQLKGQDEEEMGDGQFERFSSARRTRRYKKNQESDKEDQSPLQKEESTEDKQTKLETCSQLIPEKQILRPNTQQAHSLPVSTSEELSHPLSEESQKRLKKWQDRLNPRPSPENDLDKDKRTDDSDGVTQEALANISKSSKELQNLDAISRTGRPNTRFLTGVDRNDVMQALRNRPTESKLTARDRVRSMIEPSQVHEALKHSRGGGEITPTVPRVPKGPSACSQYLLHGSPAFHHGNKTRQSNELIPEIRVQASTPAVHGKLRSEHDLLDEGFEETQSLVSETLSQGTSSDVVDSPARKKPIQLNRADSSGSGETSSSTHPSTQPTINGVSTAPAKLSENNVVSTARHKLERSNSVKAAFGSRAETGRSGSSAVPRRSPSLRQVSTQGSAQPVKNNVRNSSVERSNSKSSLRGSRSSLITDGHCGPNSKRPAVERSNSRTSLRSSRSSLASATSVNTVKNIPSPVTKSSNQSNVGRMTGYTSAIKSLTSNLNRTNPDCNNSVGKDLNKLGLNRSITPKRPLATVQPKAPKTSVPASRSSSSGSSIGPTIQRPKITSGLGTSFKENSHTGALASRSSSSGSSVGTSPKKVSTLNKITLKPVSSSGLRFMRPTAASVAKDIPGTVSKSRPGIRSVFK
ncbi:hypothetical protein FOCC_FOCC008776, partial [Frankliniella occidentalis]